MKRNNEKNPGWNALGRAAMVALGMATVVACGGGGESGNGSRQTAQARLLIGDDSDLALTATTKLRTAPAQAAAVTEQGLIRTRLDAILNPNATVGSINQALEEYGALIADMNAGHWFVSLSIPWQANAGDAHQLAQSLEESGAFLAVFPSYRLTGDVAMLPDENLDNETVNASHLKSLRMPAAWNLATAMESTATLPVLIPDIYYSAGGHSQLTALRFLSHDAADFDAVMQTDGTYRGNHGYHVAGVLAANFDDVAPTGIHPSPEAHLDVMALPLGNRNMTETLSAIVDAFPSALNKKFVVNLSLGYPETSFDEAAGGLSRYRRALEAMQWRLLTGSRRDAMFYAAAAGNKGQWDGDAGSAKFESPFCAALLFDDLREMAASETLGPAEQSVLDQLWQDLLDQYPAAAVANRNWLGCRIC